MSYQKSYYPKRPVKSFQDLEVYQKALAICVAVTKRIPEDGINSITKPLHECVLALPLQIATAHSIRFSNPEKSIAILEEVMLNCNKTIVYMEQYRDICNPRPASEVARSSDGKSLPKAEATIAEADVPEIESIFFEELIKNLLSARMKIMHLQRSWKKFMTEYKKESKTI